MNDTAVVVGGPSPYDWEQDDDYRTAWDAYPILPQVFLTCPEAYLASAVVILLLFALAIVVGRT